MNNIETVHKKIFTFLQLLFLMEVFNGNVGTQARVCSTTTCRSGCEELEGDDRWRERV